MFSDYFLALLLSHLAGDFVFQSDQLCKLKKEPDIKQRVLGISIHVVIMMLINITVFGFMAKGIPWIVLFLVNFFHWLIDMAKSTILASLASTGQMEAKPQNKLNVCLFIADQLLHIISIFIAAHALYSFDVNHYRSFFDQLVSGTVMVSKSLTILKKILLILIYLCLATSVSNVIVKMFLSGLRKDLGADVKTGRYIGGVERILTISIILAGAWQALTVLYGSKTAIRFDQAKDNPDFAEYYILGTTLSALLAAIIAVAVKITLL